MHRAGPLELATRYAAWALHTPAGRAHTAAGILFKAPAKTDPQNLLHHAQSRETGGVRSFTIKPEHRAEIASQIDEQFDKQFQCMEEMIPVPEVGWMPMPRE